MTPLLDGRVLVTGGQSPGSTPTSTAEIFTPATSTFTPTGAMQLARYLHR